MWEGGRHYPIFKDKVNFLWEIKLRIQGLFKKIKYFPCLSTVLSTLLKLGKGGVFSHTIASFFQL